MPIPDHFHAFWCALDELLASVRPTWWGATVTDERFPAIWDANYARVDAASELSAADIEAALLPALEGSGAEVMHVVMFHPEQTTALISELSTRGHSIRWDLVMDLSGEPSPADPSIDVEEIGPSPQLSEAIEASLGIFQIEGAEASMQLLRLEEQIMMPAGKRWFCVRDSDGSVASLGAMIVLEGVTYLDNVCTFPAARGRGYAGAITRRLCREGLSRGASSSCLIVDPIDESAVAIYERAGFKGVGKMGSTKGPLPGADQAGGS